MSATGAVKAAKACDPLLSVAFTKSLRKSNARAAGRIAVVAAETTTEVSTTEVDFTEFLPCTGEDVHWTGTVMFRLHGVTNRGAEVPEGVFQHVVVEISTRLTGVGETSGGDTYRWNQVDREGIQSESLTEPTGSHTLVSPAHIIGPTGGLVGVVTAHLIEVATPSGNRLVPKDDIDFAVECQ
jgi:hypothetical protein